MRIDYYKSGLLAEDERIHAQASLDLSGDGYTVILTEHHTTADPHPAQGDQVRFNVRYELAVDELIRLIIAHGSECLNEERRH